MMNSSGSYRRPRAYVFPSPLPIVSGKAIYRVDCTDREWHDLKLFVTESFAHPPDLDSIVERINAREPGEWHLRRAYQILARKNWPLILIELQEWAATNRHLL